jgi:hypothetical protein
MVHGGVSGRRHMEAPIIPGRGGMRQRE